MKPQAQTVPEFETEAQMYKETTEERISVSIDSFELRPNASVPSNTGAVIRIPNKRSLLRIQLFRSQGQDLQEERQQALSSREAYR
jgi:hypothetical protein